LQGLGWILTALEGVDQIKTAATVAAGRADHSLIIEQAGGQKAQVAATAGGLKSLSDNLTTTFSTPTTAGEMAGGPTNETAITSCSTNQGGWGTQITTAEKQWR